MLPTKPLGNTGLNVTRIGFGAWGIGSKHYGKVDESQAIEALAAYLEGGGNFIDTARGYNQSEAFIGRFIKQRKLRDQVVISSKIWGNDESTIRTDLETTLSELQIDCLDLYHLHDPPSDIDEMNAALDVMEKLKGEGKIRGIAASIKGGNVTPDTQVLCRQYINTRRIDAIQLIFSALRQDNREIFEEAEKANVAIIARTCLENGFLTGKYESGYRFPEGFPEGDHRSRWNGEKLDGIIEQVNQLKSNTVANPYTSMAEVALRYVFEESGVTTMIPGAKNRQQSESNIAIADMPPLSNEIRQKINQMGQTTTSLVNLD
jgi:aryl-alcohol dehydrogenase-like predicted oxidoreductase